MASISMGTLYGYANGSNYGRYTCTFSYDSVTRSGSTVYVNNAKVTMTRYSSGYTTNRIAGCAGIGGSTNNIANNKTLSSSGKQSPATITFDLGSPSYNTTGTSVSIYVAVASTGGSSSWGNFVANSPLVLNTTLTCPAAATSISTFSVSKISGYSGINGVSVSWSTTNSINYIWYSKDNGSSWTGLSASGTSGSFNITGLSANTGYNFKIRVRRSDTNVTTDSGTYYQSTYAINTISSAPTSISNGSSLTVTASNPSGASCQIRLETIINNSTVSRYTKSGTNVTFSAEEITNLLQYATNTTAFTIRVVADTLNGSNIGYNSWKDLTYNVINSNPIFSNFTFMDSNNTIVGVTENNQVIVKNYSTLRVVISSQDKMVAQNWATPVRYDIVAANRSGTITYQTTDTYLDLGTINVSGDIDIVVTATCSRGLKTSKTLSIKVTDYFIPSLNVVLGRVNNFEDNTTLIASGNFALLNNKNSILEVSYRYKESKITNWDNIDWISFTYSQSSGAFNTNPINMILSNRSSFNFQVKVVDKITTQGFIADYFLDEGIPIMFINSSRKNIGIGCLNEIGGEYSLAMSGEIYLKSGNEVLDYEVIDEWD